MPSPEAICAYAERAEDLGIDSIWLSDHLVSRRPTLEISCVMAMFAARTKRIKMGPSVLTLPARNPVEVAKTYATLDYLTGGQRRVIMAVGIGSDPRDSQAIGVPTEERGGRLAEGVEILRKLWSAPNVTHEGKYYRFTDVTIEPRPARGPLDIWVGGRSAIALKRVARYGDGWFPSFITPDEFREGIARLTALGAEMGRKIDADEAGVVLLAHVGDDRAQAAEMLERTAQALGIPAEALATRAAFGSAEEVAERVREYARAGCTKYVLWPIGSPDDLVPQIEAYGRQILPRFN
jgi:probable F420-dependent oxidoreductase